MVADLECLLNRFDVRKVRIDLSWLNSFEGVAASPFVWRSTGRRVELSNTGVSSSVVYGGASLPVGFY